jgi:hypothetical protein
LSFGATNHRDEEDAQDKKVAAIAAAATVGTGTVTRDEETKERKNEPQSIKGQKSIHWNSFPVYVLYLELIAGTYVQAYKNALVVSKTSLTERAWPLMPF